MIRKYWLHSRFFEKPKLKFISWFDRQFPGKYCWADCVIWSFDPERWNPFNVERSIGCEIESIEHEHETCYCGGWNKGVCFARLTKEQQQRIRDEADAEWEKLKNNMPF